MKIIIGACASSLLFMSAGAQTSVDGRAIADEQRGNNWLSYGRTYAEHFFSPLMGINDRNVNRLGLSWFLDLPGQRTLEATPLAVDGVLYFSGTYGKVFAVDAKSGQKLWEFDAASGIYRPEIFRFSGSLGGHRGVAFWRGKVYVGVIDGRLFAIDAKTGKPVWNVQTFDEPKGRKAISGAPRVFNGNVIIGHNGDPGARGYVTAYDAESGQLRWRFYTVPGDPDRGFENEALAMAAKTWEGQWWKSGGNGSVWDSIVYDSEFNRVYFGTANSISERSSVSTPPKGDNLFVSSIVAVDADSGKYAWHYQENPRGHWDYDSNMPIVLADLHIGGKPRKALLHAPKNGFFYVIDRTTGKVISAEKFARVTWAERIDLKSGRPIEMPDPPETWPSILGAHSWQPMSFNPATRLVYIPTMNIGSTFTRVKSEGIATILAWDPVAQTKRWEVRHEDSLWNGGTMTTAGNLVFQGTGRGQFVAYSATTGDRLWSFDAGLGIIGTPVSYEIDGVQHISVLVGYGGAVGVLGKRFDYGWRYNEQPRRLLTFALDKQLALPVHRAPRYVVRAADDPTFVIDKEKAAKGSELYESAWCSLCHGPKLENNGSFAPDLRESFLAMNWEAFRSVLRDGSLSRAGMPKYDDLSEHQHYAIFMYVRQRAREAAQTPP
ncbi:outer membrane protein assembly factor BamB family protein [Peristeroidobacter agariperforans]|uniref:outer membrane protein assembly factor BamB family protein n=1 Tax=Peristeroidobacter agariperforans TaxID=268404 RepID=UPI00101B932C|nr:PQQ-binding-like beta-propeller repeat protein [Peristeroidobacter agariperforans]